MEKFVKLSMKSIGGVIHQVGPRFRYQIPRQPRALVLLHTIVIIKPNYVGYEGRLTL